MLKGISLVAVGVVFLALVYFGSVMFKHLADVPVMKAVKEPVAKETVINCVDQGRRIVWCSDVKTGCQYYIVSGRMLPRLGTSGKPYCLVKNLR
jgi:hypothetical protein